MSTTNTGILESLIAALNANTAAILAQQNGAGAADAGTKTTSTKGSAAKNTKPPKDEKPAATHTKAEATEVVTTVKEKLGVDAAKALLSKHGFKKLVDITEDKVDALYDEGTALLEGSSSEEAGDDDGI